MVSVDVKHHVYLHAAKLRHVLLTRFRPTDEHFTDTQHTADEHFTDTQHPADILRFQPHDQIASRKAPCG